MTKVFISHSKKDEFIAKTFIDKVLVGGLGLNLNCDIFCTSVDGAKISTSENWRSEIKEALINSTVSILIITPNYRESEVCMNEMGAIWANSKHIIPLIIDPIEFTDFSALLCEVQGEILTNEKGLDRTKDQLAKIFKITGLKSDNWTRQKDELLSTIRIYLEKKPFLPILSRTTFDNIASELNKAKEANDSLCVENKNLSLQYEQLKKLKDKDDVLTLEREYSDESEYEEFHNLVDAVRASPKDIDGVILTLIYNDFTKNELNIDYQLYSDELRKAAARGLIDDADNIQTDNRQINQVRSALKALEHFLADMSEETYSLIKKDSPDDEIDIRNLDFWENVLQVKLSYK